MITIFPSWSHLDQEAMSDLRRASREFVTAIEVCDEIAPRHDWLSIAQDGIRRSDCVVLILTANSAASVHCKKEVLYAGSVGKRTLIWAPGPAPVTPEWVGTAGWLGGQRVDAKQVLAIILGIQNVSLR